MIATLAASGVLLGGQAPQTAPGQDPSATFRSSVDAVQLTFIVTDASGVPVAGLTADDFEILENRSSRPITTFEAIDISIERRERDLAEPDVLTTRGPRNSGQEFTRNPRLLVEAINKFDGGDDDGNRERNFIGDFRNLMAFMAKIDVELPGPPTTAREFSRDDTLVLFAEAYENRKKPHTLTLTVELRAESGRVLGTHVIERKAVEQPKEASVYAFAPNLSLETCLPGGTSSASKRRPRWTTAGV